MMKSIREIFIRQKRDRMLKRNQNFIIAIVGPTGSGKTYAAITLADELMYGKLNAAVHIVFTIEEFLNLINSGVLKRGDIVVFEEAGVSINSKNWASKANKNINFVLQTCRHMNFGIIFTLPLLKFLENASRSLLHTSMVTNEGEIDYENKIAWLKVYDFKAHPLKSIEPYLIIPKFWIDGILTKMRKIAVRMPRQELLDIYEPRKAAYTKKLYEDTLKRMNAESEDQEKKYNKAKPCDICGSTEYRERVRTGDWKCRNGHVTQVDPWLKTDDNNGQY